MFFIRIHPAPHRRKTTLARRRAAGFAARSAALCLLTALCLPPLSAAARVEERPPAVRSNASIEGWFAPFVPESLPVDDGYFTDAVLVGDSLTSGVPHYKVLPALEAIYKIGLAPRTIAADERPFTLNGRSASLPEVLAARAPRIVYLWLGLNGVDGSPASKVLLNYHIMLNRLIEALPDTAFCLVELPPVTKDAVKRHPALTNKNVEAFNAGLRDLALEHNVCVLSIHDLLLGDGVLAKRYAEPDGVHLKVAAYQVIVDFLRTHAVPTLAAPILAAEAAPDGSFAEPFPPGAVSPEEPVPEESVSDAPVASTADAEGAFPARLKNPNGGSIVNFRTQPSIDSEILTTYPVGMPVTVLELAEEWALVSIDGAVGYVSSYFLEYDAQYLPEIC